MVGTRQLEDAMNKLVFAIALFLTVPALRAQQAETSGRPPQTEPQAAQPAPSQPAAQNPNSQDNLPPELRPGHPLDPADVDILTGKRDREIEAARRAAIPALRAPTEVRNLRRLLLDERQTRPGMGYSDASAGANRQSVLLLDDAAARVWTRRISRRPLNEIRLSCALFFTESPSWPHRRF